MASIRSVILAMIALSVAATAQKPVIGYFEFKDERSGAVGLRKHFPEYEGVEARFFDIARPDTFEAEKYDVIMFGSFSEFHPAWNDFVRREKNRILAQVERGALLIVFNRHRKNDRNGKKLTLLPPGYSVQRSGNDFREIYFSEVLHPMWKGMTRRPSRGWHRLDGGKIGRKDQPALLDAFEEWSQNFKKSAGPRKRASGGWAAALTAEYGRGEIHLFQLTYDKLEEATGRRSRAAAREFFKALIVYIGRRPKFAKPQPVVRGGGPPTRGDPSGDDPPPIDPVPPPRKQTVLLRARVFEDVDGDGDFDVGEPTIPGVRVVDGGAAARTGSSGLATTEVSRKTDRTLHIDVPDGFDAASGWYVEVPFTRIGDLDAVDVLFPLTRLAATGGRRLLFARLDRLAGPGALDGVASDLATVFEREQPDVCVLLVDAAERAGAALADRLLETGLPVRVVTPARDAVFGPAEAAFELDGVRFLSTGGDGLSRLAERGLGARAVVLVAGAATASAVDAVVRAGASGVVASAGPADVEALRLAPRLAEDGYGVVDVVGGAVTFRIGPDVVSDVNPVDDGEGDEGDRGGDADPVDTAPPLPVRASHPHVSGSLEAAVKAALDGESSSGPRTDPPPDETPARAAVEPAITTVRIEPRQVVAHAGGGAEAPADTLTAVQAALKSSCGAIEIDVRLTADGKLALFHDDSIGAGNGDLTGKAVSEVPYFELRKVDVGADGRRESPPLLEDVLALDWGTTRVMIDAKAADDAPRLGAALAKRIAAWKGKALVDLASADPTVLRAFHAGVEDVPLAAMIAKAADVPRFDGLPVSIWAVKDVELEASVAAFLGRGGRQVRVGVVDDPVEARRLLAIPGVAAVVTDAPARLLGR